MSGAVAPTEAPDFDLVWGAGLDGRYNARVQRTGDPYRGRLTLIDIRSGEVLIDDLVAMICGAIYGPDIRDVEMWQRRCMEVVDRLPRA